MCTMQVGSILQIVLMSNKHVMVCMRKFNSMSTTLRVRENVVQIAYVPLEASAIGIREVPTPVWVFD